MEIDFGRRRFVLARMYRTPELAHPIHTMFRPPARAGWRGGDGPCLAGGQSARSGWPRPQLGMQMGRPTVVYGGRVDRSGADQRPVPPPDALPATPERRRLAVAPAELQPRRSSATAVAAAVIAGRQWDEGVGCAWYASEAR